MMPLLVFRERIRNFYQRYDLYVLPAFKFILAFIVFQLINKEIGYDSRLEKLPVVLVLSLLSAFTPSAVMVLLAALVSILHVFYVSDILSVIIVLIIAILYFMFARFTPKLGFVVLAIPILYIIKIPYVIPLLLGVVATPIAIIPTACGVVIYFLFDVIQNAATMQVNLSVEDTLQLYTYVIDSLRNNKQMFMSIVIFSLILLVTYFVRKMKFDYAFETSIGVGALTGMLGFLISNLIMDKTNEILFMILGSIASAIIAYAIHFLKLALDYSGVERVQFEDDVYYYYVKAVPKITVTTPQMNVKHINVKKADYGFARPGSMHRHNVDADDEYDDGDDSDIEINNLHYKNSGNVKKDNADE